MREHGSAACARPQPAKATARRDRTIDFAPVLGMLSSGGASGERRQFCA
jgi:hypothetical protein